MLVYKRGQKDHLVSEVWVSQLFMCIARFLSGCGWDKLQLRHFRGLKIINVSFNSNRYTVMLQKYVTWLILVVSFIFLIMIGYFNSLLQIRYLSFYCMIIIILVSQHSEFMLCVTYENQTRCAGSYTFTTDTSFLLPISFLYYIYTKDSFRRTQL